MPATPGSEACSLATASTPYSGFATLAIRKSAGGEEGGYVWANKEAYKALTNTILNIQAALETYKGQDEATADAFKGEGK